MAKGKTAKVEPGAKTKGGSDQREKKGMRVVIRVLGTDVDGEKSVRTAILKIKGVGHSFANAICKAADINPNKKLGSFTESEIARLEEVINDPTKVGLPAWTLNRRKDIESGKDMHVSSSDVDVSKKFDVQRMVDKKSYKGVRHMLGLPVRGQRTRSSFRRGRTVGVIRKSVRIASGGGGSGAPKKEKK